MNPTNDVFEQRMAALEKGVAATAVSSGKQTNKQNKKSRWESNVYLLCMCV